MYGLFQGLSQSQAQSSTTKSRHRAGRTLVLPERLEPRNAPGVMLPLLPIFELPTDETAVVDEVDPLDLYGTERKLSTEFKKNQELISTAARDLAIDKLSYESVEKTVAELATTTRRPFTQDHLLAAGFIFDRLEATNHLVSGHLVSELAPQLATLSSALALPIAENTASKQTNTPTPVAAPEVATSPAASPAAATASTLASGAVSGAAAQPTPTRLASSPAARSATLPLPRMVQTAPTTEASVTATPLLNSPPAVVSMPAENSPPGEAASSTLAVALDSIATPASPTATVAVESQATPSAVSNALTVLTASSGEDSELIVPAKLISEADVDLLLNRAAQATASENAIIAIVDRGGRILGVQVEQGVIDTITNPETLVFAIDGAVAKARTAAFFSNDQAPLTSRTVRFISQSTVTQREVQSNPNVSEETIRGPGFVAPIGLGGHFPPDVLHTPHVDLFAIEHTNRDSLVHPGLNRVKEAATVDDNGQIIAAGGDDIFLGSRFGATFVEGQEIDAPESYGVVSGMLTSAQSRGIATLPGGVPLYKFNSELGSPELVGGIGVFFPGDQGYADHEQGFVAGVGQSTNQRTNANLVLEAEYIAGIVALNETVINGQTPVPHFVLPLGRIDLVGITLETLGPHPGIPGDFLPRMASQFTEGDETGMRMRVNPGGATAIAGEAVPVGWLVKPTASSDRQLSAADVEKIIVDGIAEAELVRSAIRLPLGTRSSMVLAVADKEGEILGLFRMPDSTFFSIDVAVAKSRNVAYYADLADLQDIDQVDFDGNGTSDLPAGTALTNRTFRFLAEPRFPSGVDGSNPAPFSILRDPGIDPKTGENLGAPTPSTSFTSVLGFDAFNPSSNFREPVPTTGFQNGIVFFPGSTPLYNNAALVGGLGVSGDGVDQDDVVTFSGAGDFLPRGNSGVTRADEVFIDGVRLPYQKFLRNPRG